MDVIKRFGQEHCADWVPIGVPKLDPLFWDGYYNRDKVLAGLGLDPSMKTVLFAPSYRPSCIPFLGSSVAVVADKYNLIIKLHPYSWGGKYAPASQSTTYVNLVRKHPKIALVPKEDYDFHPYMFASDTVISDTSSALAICLALGRVGIIADFPYPRMRHSDGWPIVAEEPGEYLKGVFVHVSDKLRLMDAVEEALNPSRQHLERLTQYRQYYFTGLDGRAGERAKKAIEERIT
jgi:CDP-glycerol glycerophosphotransferase (TagB/SpsB family)